MTISAAVQNVRYWHKADIPTGSTNVRFTPESGHWLEMPQCLLLTQSGHRRLKIAAMQLDV